MDDVEVEIFFRNVKSLIEENRRLDREVEELTQENADLVGENERLKSELGVWKRAASDSAWREENARADGSWRQHPADGQW